MVIYSGVYLQIIFDKENNRFINTWILNPKSTEAFKSEMLAYLTLQEKNKPSQVLWLQKKFTFKMDYECKLWFEKTIIKPRFKAGFISKDTKGFHHIAFVLGKDVLANIEITGIFKQTQQSVFKPKYFATEKTAKKWLDGEDEKKPKKQKQIEINYKGVNRQGKSVIEIKEDPSNINSSIQSLKSFLEDRDFIRINMTQFSSLSPKENETLRWITEGYLNQDISVKMGLSINTVRTYRNRIWKKLKITNFENAYRYRVFFN